MVQGNTAKQAANRAEVFRTNMRSLLEGRWLSQRQAAEEIGVDYKWMRRACHRGLKRTDSRTVDNLQRVADFFCIKIDDLWNEPQQRPNKSKVADIRCHKRKVPVPLSPNLVDSASVEPPRYEPVLELPSLSPEDFMALRDNIAVNGVLVPIVVDCDGPVRKIIDGNYRKRIADEFGYDCPEIVHAGLDEDEKRTLARALNLARRQLSREQKRELIADQLCESPDRSNRWVAKQLGVHHATVASVRSLLESNGHIEKSSERLGSDGKVQPAQKSIRSVLRTPEEHQKRIDATSLIFGDCVHELPKLASSSVDAVITDPIYPEVDREYGKITEAEWHDLMRVVVTECRRILKPTGSAVFILQPNYEHVGQMRLWLWEFLVWAAKEWNLVQDVYSWTQDAMPLTGTSRKQGLMRQSVKMSIWLGPKDCYRDQDAVLNTPSQRTTDRSASDERLVLGRNEKNYKPGGMANTAAERGGTTPFNMMPISNGGRPRGDHPATTPQQLADWWCRYILPENGVLLDCFAGSGGILSSGLNHGASKVIGIEKEERYVEMAWKRIREG